MSGSDSTPLNTVLTNTVEVLTPSSPSLINLNMSNITKLFATNCIMWSRQIQALLDGYALFHYLDDSAKIPDKHITTNDTVTANPESDLWNRQDRLIHSALIGSISLSIQSLVSRANTTAEIWSTLASTYAKPSRRHIKQLKHQLKQWSKGTRTINEYLQGLTVRFDQLVLLGKVIDHEDQGEYILEGLSDDNKSLVDQVEERYTPPNITELHERLLNHEAKLISATPVSSFPITANYVNNRSRPSPKTNQSQHQPWKQ